MLTENQTRWLEALRSGKYKQGRENLHDENGCMCCLGVAASMSVPADKIDYDPEGGTYSYCGTVAVAPRPTIDWLKLRNNVGCFDFDELDPETAERIRSRVDPDPEPGDDPLPQTSLATMNDRGFSFEEIADFIEAHPEVIFRA